MSCGGGIAAFVLADYTVQLFLAGLSCAARMPTYRRRTAGLQLAALFNNVIAARWLSINRQPYAACAGKPTYDLQYAVAMRFVHFAAAADGTVAVKLQLFQQKGTLKLQRMESSMSTASACTHQQICRVLAQN